MTCLPCREYARSQHLEQADSAEHLLQLYDTEPEFMVRAGTQSGVTPADLAQAAREHRATAARYA